MFFLHCSSFKECPLQFEPFLMTTSEQQGHNKKQMERERLLLPCWKYSPDSFWTAFKCWLCARHLHPVIRLHQDPFHQSLLADEHRESGVQPSLDPHGWCLWQPSHPKRHSVSFRVSLGTSRATEPLLCESTEQRWGLTFNSCRGKRFFHGKPEEYITGWQ